MIEFDSIEFTEEASKAKTATVRSGRWGKHQVLVQIRRQDKKRAKVDPSFVEDTDRKLRATSHPALCHYYGAGVAEMGPFVVTEDARGRPLTAAWAEALKGRDFSSCVASLVDGLRALHANQLVHGHITEQNVRYDEQRPFIFGFDLDPASAPEDDYFALGRVLYRCVTKEDYAGKLDRDAVAKMVGPKGADILEELIEERRAPELDAVDEDEFERLYGRSASLPPKPDLDALTIELAPFFIPAVRASLAKLDAEEGASSFGEDAMRLVAALRDSKAEDSVDLAKEIETLAGGISSDADDEFVRSQSTQAAFALLAHVRTLIDSALRTHPQVELGPRLLPLKMNETQKRQFVQLDRQLPGDSITLLGYFAKKHAGDTIEMPPDIVISRKDKGFVARKS